MERELKLPDVGEGIAEGEIVQWLVEPGDQVSEDQAVAEVETDKAVVEVPSPIDGTVKSLHASEGEIVEVDSIIVTFETDGDDVEIDEEAEPSDATGEETSAETTADEASAETTASAGPAENGDSADAPATGGPTATGKTDGESVPASQVIAPPRVKRLARELGVDIGALAGAADGTPITAEAVRRAAGEGTEPPAQESEPSAQKHQSAPETTPAESESATTTPQEPANTPESTATAQPSSTTSGTVDREKTLAAPATRQLARERGVDIDTVPASEQRKGQPFVTAADVRSNAGNGSEPTGQAAAPANATAAGGTSQQSSGVSGGEERIPYRGIRRTIGKQMEEAKYNAPHVSHHDEVDVTELQAVRRDLNDELDEGVSLTYMPFVMKAVVRALKDHPEINSTLDTENEEIVQKYYYNLGVATATDAGLMVPVVQNVDQKGLVQLASEVGTVVERARSRDISPAEMQDGTFTITNFGAIGGDHATPIINYPEAAILGLGAIKERPMVVDGEVEARTTLPLSLTVDHRLIDGSVAASFTNDVKRYLNNPALLMI